MAVSYGDANDEQNQQDNQNVNNIKNQYNDVYNKNFLQKTGDIAVQNLQDWGQEFAKPWQNIHNPLQFLGALGSNVDTAINGLGSNIGGDLFALGSGAITSGLGHLQGASDRQIAEDEYTNQNLGNALGSMLGGIAASGAEFVLAPELYQTTSGLQAIGNVGNFVNGDHSPENAGDFGTNLLGTVGAAGMISKSLNKGKKLLSSGTKIGNALGQIPKPVAKGMEVGGFGIPLAFQLPGVIQGTTNMFGNHDEQNKQYNDLYNAYHKLGYH
jgi:hypothetical protein